MRLQLALLEDFGKHPRAMIEQIVINVSAEQLMDPKLRQLLQTFPHHNRSYLP